MRILDAFTLMRSLSPALKTLRTKRHVSGKRTLGDWLELIREAIEFEDRRSRVVYPMMGFTFFITAATVINLFVVILANQDWAFFQFTVLSFLIFAGLTVWSFHTFFAIEAMAMPPTIAKLVYPFLKVLECETSNSQKAVLDISLRSRMDATLAKGEAQKAQFKNKPGQPKLTRSYFESPWFHLQMSLVDQSRLDVKIIDLVRKTRVVKKNRRGKWKSKDKHKVCVKIETNLMPPSGESWNGTKQKLVSNDIEFVPALEALLNPIAEYYKKQHPKGRSPTP